jgi:hypothetical protein
MAYDIRMVKLVSGETVLGKYNATHPLWMTRLFCKPCPHSRGCR